MKAFEQSSYLAQVMRLRRLAEEALKRYPIKVKSIDFINHGENTTFKITDIKGVNYLLRIHRWGYHSKEAILEELSWLEDISKTTNIIVPKPLRSKDNNLIETILKESVTNERHVCVFHWIGGNSLWMALRPKHMHLIGQKMASLQIQSKKRKVYYRKYWDAEGLVGKNPKMGSILTLPSISHSTQKFVNDQRRETFKTLSRYEKKHPQNLGLIHADMHFGNLLFDKNDVGIIDFDDSGYGCIIYDIIVPLIMIESVLRQRKESDEYERYEAALLEGYSSLRPLSQEDIDMIIQYKKARRLSMLGWITSRMDNPSIKKIYKRNLKITLNFLKNN